MSNKIQAVAAREVVSVVRARSTLALLLGVLLVTFGVVFVSNAEPDYLPTAVDLLLPMEFLVPALAVALGYRTIISDSTRGELDVLATYPVSVSRYILGVFVGRALALTVLLTIPLTIVGVYLATTSPTTPTFLATHQGVDSPLIFVRFIGLTVFFGLVVLAMTIAVSALASTQRSALVLGLVVLALVIIGLDLLILRGVAGGTVGDEWLTAVLSVSPTSAYRGLVFETVLSTAVETDLQQASPVTSAAGLLSWLLGSLAVATVSVSRR